MIIPFFIPHAGCPHQCVFCNQKHISGRHMPETASTIPATIRSYISTRRKHGPVEVAFYGGSFTALPLDQQRDYLRAIQPFMQAGTVDTIRLSTRPDCINREIIDLLREHQVSIVELGAQSMDDNVLSAAGRGHVASDTVYAAELLRERDIRIGLQVMPGLPGDTQARFANTVDAVIRIKPEFIRLYPTIVIRDTPLARLYQDGQYVPLTLDEAIAWCSDAVVRFNEAGIEVIRMGLQATDALSEPGMILAGPFHPAFGQLVESELYLRKMRVILSSHRDSSRTAVFRVHRQDVSTALGQKRANLATLQREFKLQDIAIRSDDSIRTRGNPVLGP